jgi:hypothetical protein
MRRRPLALGRRGRRQRLGVERGDPVGQEGLPQPGGDLGRGGRPALRRRALDRRAQPGGQLAPAPLELLLQLRALRAHGDHPVDAERDGDQGRGEIVSRAPMRTLAIMRHAAGRLRD